MWSIYKDLNLGLINWSSGASFELGSLEDWLIDIRKLFISYHLIWSSTLLLNIGQLEGHIYTSREDKQ